MGLDMVYLNVDGKRYEFDNYDDLEVTKSILEDILTTSWMDQRIKTIRVVNSMRKVLESKRLASF